MSSHHPDTVIRRLETILGQQMLPGHTITRLRNGDQIFPAMVRSMRAAERSIDLLTFVYWTGTPAKVIGKTLESKAREGLRVRIILDVFGAARIDRDLVKSLEDAGVQLHWFRPPIGEPTDLAGIGKRTHRKICVIDETEAYVGGVGIAEEWDGDARSPEEWRDDHFHVTGPAVATIRAGFIDDWATSGQPLVTHHDVFPSQEGDGDARAMVILGESEIGDSAVALVKRALLEIAMDRIRLTTAYFSPNEEMAGWLCEAARRGVDVQVMFPGTHIDKRLPQANGERAYPDLLEAGVTLWSYEKTMLHAKILTIDGVLADVGSSNYNDRSIQHDEEIDLIAWDPALVEILDQDFEADRVNCIEVDGEWLEERSTMEKVQATASGLIDGFI